MYKGNGVTKAFPLPPGADGSVVALVTESGAVRMKEGDAYEVVGGSVVFGVAPPEGVAVTFAVPDGSAVASGFCTVIYADGRTLEVSKDPAELLVQALGMFDESKKALRRAEASEERAGKLFPVEVEKAKKELELLLLDYKAEVRRSIEGAVAATQEGQGDLIAKNLLEIRNKHKAVMAAHAEVEELAKYTEESANSSAIAAAQGVHECCAKATAACEEIRQVRAEVLDLRDQARNAATNTAVDAAKGFEARAGIVLEEIKSLRSTLQGEVKALVERARDDAKSEMDNMRATRDLAVRAAQRCEEIERRAKDLLYQVEGAVKNA